MVIKLGQFVNYLRNNWLYYLFLINITLISSRYFLGAPSPAAGISIALLFGIFVLLAKHKANSRRQQYFFSAISFLAIFIGLLYFPVAFNNLTLFLFNIPLVYAYLLSDWVSPTIVSLFLIGILGNYTDPTLTKAIVSVSASLISTGFGYTIIFNLLRKLTTERDRFHQMSLTDPLTGLANLDHTLRTGEKMLESGAPFTVLLVDLDLFKQINDTYGHLAGNRILIQFANLLKQEMKEHEAIVGRLGGDEFIIIVGDFGPHQVTALRRRLIEAASKELFAADPDLAPIKLSFTLGEAYSEHKANPTIQDLLHTADMTMYYRKYQNRGCIIDFDRPCSLLPPKGVQILRVMAEKDIYTFVHSQYVAEYAEAIGKEHRLDQGLIEELCVAGWLHDIGKILIPAEILRKPTHLEPAEYQVVMEHVVDGPKIVEGLNLGARIQEAVKYHHERWDGSGPFGLAGTEIPLAGRILQVADAFSAMTIKRLYRPRLSTTEALQELRKGSGIQFDPQLVESLACILKRRLPQEDAS